MHSRQVKAVRGGMSLPMCVSEIRELVECFWARFRAFRNQEIFVVEFFMFFQFTYHAREIAKVVLSRICFI